MGRNSATGSQRRSITITPPSEASRTNSEVWMWSSRIEVFFMMLHCSAEVFRSLWWGVRQIYERNGGFLFLCLIAFSLMDSARTAFTMVYCSRGRALARSGTKGSAIVFEKPPHPFFANGDDFDSLDVYELPESDKNYLRHEYGFLPALQSSSKVRAKRLRPCC